MWCPRAGGFRPPVSSAGHCDHPLSRSSPIFCAIGLLIGRPRNRDGDCAPPAHSTLLQHIVCCCHVIGRTLLNIAFCANHIFFVFFHCSDRSEGTTVDRVVSPRPIMVHHGFRSKEERCKKRIIFRQRTSHSSLLVACQDDVSSKLNLTFLYVDSFNSNF